MTKKNPQPSERLTNLLAHMADLQEELVELHSEIEQSAEKVAVSYLKAAKANLACAHTLLRLSQPYLPPHHEEQKP